MSTCARRWIETLSWSAGLCLLAIYAAALAWSSYSSDQGLDVMREARASHTADIDTVQSTRRYRVTSISVVAPQDVAVLADTGRPSVTLVTCYPWARYSWLRHAYRCCSAAAFVLPGIDCCPLLPPLLTVRGAVDRAKLGRTDEEGICPWVRIAGSPESLACLSQYVADVDSTHG
jgi:hypothetical protein